MKPVIAIIGRPNVGKSTLFNRLTNSRAALVADEPGVTRDRQYGIGIFDEQAYIIIDTGGLDDGDMVDPAMADIVSKQSLQAAKEADAVVWVVDGRDGLTTTDEKLVRQLRQVSRRLYLAVNKSEGMDASIVTAEFHALGINHVHAISAQRGSGLNDLLKAVSSELPEQVDDTASDGVERTSITILGRPNVGKSTLMNRILGEDRVLTFDQPGTTRDSIAVTFERHGHAYTLIDTAGVRRRSRIQNTVEKISVIKTMQAIEESQIVILVIDAHEGVTDQDASLLGMAIDSGKSLIIAVNKWDGLETPERNRIRDMLDRKLGFIDYACIHYISALHGSGVGKLFDSINKIGKSIKVSPSASRLTKILQTLTTQHSPPVIHGHRIKLRYAHIGGHNPLRIIIHGNQTVHVPDDYQRYLANHFRKALKLTGTPVFINFKQGENPYKDKKNILTGRQKTKRKRLLKHVKK